MSDRKLLKKVRDGDKEALSDIIKQYYADIFRFCLYMIQNEEDSYDITQETFLKFMKYGTSYQRNNLKGYLLTIARNLCFDYQQRKKEAGKISVVMKLRMKRKPENKCKHAKYLSISGYLRNR